MTYLITQKMLRDYELRTGLKFPRRRRTGRSTFIALETIAEAIKNPGKSIRICDHHGTREADRCLAQTILEMINKLGLVALVVDMSGLSLRFNLIEPAGRCPACGAEAK